MVRASCRSRDRGRCIELGGSTSAWPRSPGFAGGSHRAPRTPATVGRAVVDGTGLPRRARSADDRDRPGPRCAGARSLAACAQCARRGVDAEPGRLEHASTAAGGGASPWACNAVWAGFRCVDVLATIEPVVADGARFSRACRVDARQALGADCALRRCRRDHARGAGALAMVIMSTRSGSNA